MRSLEGTDCCIEQVAAAVGCQLPPPARRKRQPRGQASGAGDESADDQAAISHASRGLLSRDVALVGSTADLSGREARVGFQRDPGSPRGALHRSCSRMGVRRKNQAGLDQEADTRLHHPSDRRVGPAHGRTRPSWFVGGPPGEFVADRSGIAPSPEPFP